MKHTYRIIRFFDIFFSFFGLIATSPVLLLITIVGTFDTGAPLFFQRRVGRQQQVFTLVKFRTMHIGTKDVATHLASHSAVTRLGNILRRSKLDELPQLWNVFKGEMSLVGPRPCLPNQESLISERSKRDIFRVRPGITGLAQVRGIDMSDPILLAETEKMMIEALTVNNYFRYILLTVMGHGAGDRVK